MRIVEKKNFCFSLRRVKSCSFFYKNFSVFFFGFFFYGFLRFFFVFVFNARCLFGFYFCSCHTQTHTTWLWKVQKKLKTKKRKQKKGAKEARKRRCKNCHKTFMETQRQGRTEEGQGQGQGLGERQTLVAHVAGGDTCHRLLHAAFLLPAACCGGSHFICLLIKSCDTYKCPSGVNTFACMSSASQPPLPPPSTHSPTLSPLSQLTCTACSTNECQERVKICA